jgi:hypothetical protein
MKFEKISTTLNEILSYQRSPFEKFGLGYKKKKETDKEASTSSKKLSYVDVLKNPIKVEDNWKQEHNVPHETNPSHKDIIRKTLPSRWNHTIMFQNSFLAIVILAMVLVLKTYIIE